MLFKAFTYSNILFSANTYSVPTASSQAAQHCRWCNKTVSQLNIVDGAIRQCLTPGCRVWYKSRMVNDKGIQTLRFITVGIKSTHQLFKYRRAHE